MDAKWYWGQLGDHGERFVVYQALVSPGPDNASYPDVFQCAVLIVIRLRLQAPYGKRLAITPAHSRNLRTDEVVNQRQASSVSVKSESLHGDRARPGQVFRLSSALSDHLQLFYRYRRLLILRHTSSTVRLADICVHEMESPSEVSPLAFRLLRSPAFWERPAKLDGG